MRVLERAASLLVGPTERWTKATLGRLAPAPSAMLREGGPFFAPALESVPTTGTVDEVRRSKVQNFKTSFRISEFGLQEQRDLVELGMMEVFR